MKTIIAEKPSVAREIARIVGATKREEGYFEGGGYAVTWAFGHLVQLAMPDGYGIRGSCNREELLERGFSDCLLKPFSISELMEVSDKCAMKGKQNEKPDFSSLLSYGNESVMLDKLIAETEKEMQSVRDAEQRKDFQELDALTHHLHSSWEILRADQPLRELYKQLHGSAVPDYEALNNAVTAVLDKGSEIIRLAKEERRKYENG